MGMGAHVGGGGKEGGIVSYGDKNICYFVLILVNGAYKVGG